MEKRRKKVSRHQRKHYWIAALIGAAVLALVLMVALPPWLRKRQAKHDVDTLVLALKGFALENGGYPKGSPSQLAAILRGENIGGQNPKRLDYVVANMGEMNAAGEFVDPWGKAYRISIEPDASAYSCGPNRQDENGAGDDITSWK